jgi:hypothetical protein
VTTARRTEPAWRLIRDAAGPVRGVPGKLARFGGIAIGYVNGAELDRRLERLHRIGIIERIPTKVQLAIGAWDMLRFWISPAAADYYEQQGIDYGFHQLLRFLDEPASLGDPIGLFSTKSGIIGHLMQVVHANPVYDLQLLSMFEDGLDSLESEIEAMLDGTHPRAASIGAIVEEPDYHANLLAFVRRWREDKSIAPLLRSNVSANPTYSVLELTFGTMTGAFRYFETMPRTVRGAIHHARTVHEFAG